ncbi:uncharacterized protein LOC131614096 [Vicia villosa]|uniref:uncharacterized protein LOC131614096 n=1 Tax=Vicia villosa TaxID=3911 RepID=UPI00273AA6F1|nr:uncharacterized protein LOC131614096 [Vicia villosa]
MWPLANAVAAREALRETTIYHDQGETLTEKKRQLVSDKVRPSIIYQERCFNLHEDEWIEVKDNFKDACFEMRFLNDDKEYVAAISATLCNLKLQLENYMLKWKSDFLYVYNILRLMFQFIAATSINVVHMNINKIASYEALDGIFLTNLQLIIIEIQNLTLIEIENMLQSNRRSFHEFKDMPYPDSYVTWHIGNRLICDEHEYNADTERQNFHKLFCALTYEQRSIFDKIMEAVNKQRGGVIFLHGYGGTEKTFMWRKLSSGRNAHSKFKILAPTLDYSSCNIDKDTEYSQLFEATDVIIWDEAPMSHKKCFEALDKTLKYVMSKKGLANKVFGGKVVFGGDFRHILPVVPIVGHSDIVHASISSSYV